MAIARKSGFITIETEKKYNWTEQKLYTVRWQHLRQSTSRGVIFLSPEFGKRSSGKYPYFGLSQISQNILSVPEYSSIRSAVWKERTHVTDRYRAIANAALAPHLKCLTTGQWPRRRDSRRKRSQRYTLHRLRWLSTSSDAQTSCGLSSLGH